MKYLDVLNEEDTQLIMEAPALVAILIAGADGVIDDKEIAKSIKITQKRTKDAVAYIKDYYKSVNKDFRANFTYYVQSLPEGKEARDEAIINKLAMLNEIFEKTEKTFNIVFYNSLIEFAREIAKSSGGIFGVNAISDEEKRYVDLPMIKNPAVLFNR